MTTKSFTQMIADKEIRRADAMKVQLEDIHIKPGFNLRDPDEIDADGMTFEESVAFLAELIFDGMQVPPLEVSPRDEGGVWLVDGERRTRAFRLLDSQGRLKRTPSKADPSVMEYWVPIVAFDGDEEEQEDRIFTSNKNRGLTEIEMARGCKRSAARGRKPEEIAKRIGMTRQRVDQLLILADAPPEVHQAVRAGQVSGAVATELVRKHGENATQALAEELEKAKAQGKAKVTAGTMKGPSVPRGLLDDLHGATMKLHSSLPMDARLQIDRYHKGEIAEGSVQVDLQHLMELHLILEEAQRVLADKELKAVEKANKAKQQALDGVE